MVAKCWILCMLMVAMVTGHKPVVETEVVDEIKNPLRDKAFTNDRQHILEHTKGKVNFDPDTASDDDVAFHFFSTHDTDSDGRLDGLEFFHSLEHGMVEYMENLPNKGYDEETIERQIKLIYANLEKSVDRILREDDKDGDGYLSYYEYSNARIAGHALKQPK